MLKEFGKIEESNSLFNKALEIDPNYIEANLAVAKFNDEKNNYLQAKKYYEKTLSLDVNNNLANQLYGRFLIKIGEIKKGQYYNYKYSGVIRFNEKDFEII
jgi:Tfp pilus assembly protein PilF